MGKDMMSKIRAGDVWKAMARVLDEFRIAKEDFDVLDRRPHPQLTVRYCGLERMMSFPCTPKGHGRAPYRYSARLRKMLKEMQMASLPDVGATAVQTDLPFVVVDFEDAPTVIARDGQIFTNSRDVARHFEKNHRDVMRATDTLIEQEPELALRNFAQGSYTLPETGRQEHRCFDMDRDGFTLLAMGFTGPKALKWKLRYIAAFNAMEDMLRTRPVVDLNDPAWLRGQLLTYTERVLELETKVAAQQPKVDALKRIEGADGSMCITDAAKTLCKRPRDLIAFLSSRRWIYKRAGNKNWIAFQEKIQAGYLEHDEYLYTDSQDRERASTRVLVTQKGIVALAKMLNEPLH